MASVTVTADVSASPDALWAVLSDPSRNSEWLQMHQGFVGEAPAGFTAGQSFGQKVKVLGMPADVTWTVRDVDPAHRLHLSGTGPMGIGLAATYLVEPAGDGSKVSVTMDFSGGAVMMVGSQLESEVGASLRASMEKLKALVGA